MRPIQWQLLLALCVTQTCTASPVHYFDQTILTFDEESFIGGGQRTSKPQMYYNMTFGDIDMNKKPTKPLHHLAPLDFLRMDIMNTSLAAEQDLLSKNDSNCAVTGTNAIITLPNKYNAPSRLMFDPAVPDKYNVSEFFDFKSMTLKPLGPAPRYVVAEIHAWRIANNGTALKVCTVFASWGGKGFVNPIVGNFARFFPGWGEGVNALEVSAYTQEKKPWQLCIGRLEFELNDKADDDALLRG